MLQYCVRVYSVCENGCLNSSFPSPGEILSSRLTNSSPTPLAAWVVRSSLRHIMAGPAAELTLTESEKEVVTSFCTTLKERNQAIRWEEAVKLVMARKFDLERALDLFARYKELREKLSMDSLEPLEDPLRAELATGKFTVLDATSKEGCRIAVFTTSLYKALDTEEGKALLLQNILFNLDECLLSDSAMRNGIILIVNLRSAGARIADRHFAMEVLEMLQDRYPARVTRVYVVDAPWWARALYNVVWPFLREKIRNRVQLISQPGLQRHISTDILPVTLGGKQPSMHDQWIRQCSSSYVQRNRITEDVATDVTMETEETPPPPPVRKPPPRNNEPGPPLPPERKTSLRQLNSNPQYLEDPMTLAEVNEQLEPDNVEELHHEYMAIRSEPPRGRFVSTTMSCNLRKNRYQDILALEETRVKLSIVNDELDRPIAGSDYINANFVAGMNSPYAYIAAQGPLQDTLPDWWRMVWEYRVRVIVMTTRLVERNRVKCDEYWPTFGGAQQYGDFVVEMVSQDIGQDYCTREFTIAHGLESRTVTQYQFVAWPDFGLPATAASMLEVIAAMHKTNALTKTPDSGESPVIVHCSAGVGRTGTLMATDICCQALDSFNKCDIASTVRNIRNQRAFTVQTPDQYRFIFMAVSEYGAAMAAPQTAAAVATPRPEYVVEEPVSLPPTDDAEVADPTAVDAEETEPAAEETPPAAEETQPAADEVTEPAAESGEHEVQEDEIVDAADKGVLETPQQEEEEEEEEDE